MSFDNECFVFTNLAQFITIKKAKLGPVNNSTACTHIYIYIERERATLPPDVLPELTQSTQAGLLPMLIILHPSAWQQECIGASRQLLQMCCNTCRSHWGQLHKDNYQKLAASETWKATKEYLCWEVLDGVGVDGSEELSTFFFLLFSRFSLLFRFPLFFFVFLRFFSLRAGGIGLVQLKGH